MIRNPRSPIARLRRLGRTAAAMALTAFVAGAALFAGAVPATAAEEGETYVIGTDTTFAPFEFTNAEGDLVGIDMDLLRAIAEDQGFEVEIRQLGFDAALQALQSNQVDAVMAGMSITDERQQIFDFSDPYFTSGIQLGVLESSDIQSLDDLDGKTVAVKTGTQGQTFAEDNQDEYGFRVTPYSDTTDMVDAVKANQAVGYFEDFPVLAYGIQQGSGFRLVGEPELGGEYGFAVNKGTNPELLEMFNTGLANLKESGEYDGIVDRYLSGGEESTQPTDIISVAIEYWPALMEGLWLTILSTVVAIAVSFILGIVFGFGRLSKFFPFRWISTAYVYVFRGTPILVQAFFVFFAVPQLIPDLTFNPFVAGAITLSLNTGAYMTEIIRGGIQAVDPGQNEASRSLGLGNWKTMQKVVLPQAFRIMIPSFVNQGIITLKDTSLISVIGLAELTFQSRQIIASTYLSAQVLTIVAIIYFVVITLLTLLANRLERKFNA